MASGGVKTKTYGPVIEMMPEFTDEKEWREYVERAARRRAMMVNLLVKPVLIGGKLTYLGVRGTYSAAKWLLKRGTTHLNTSQVGDIREQSKGQSTLKLPAIIGAVHANWVNEAQNGDGNGYPILTEFATELQMGGDSDEYPGVKWTTDVVGRMECAEPTGKKVVPKKVFEVVGVANPELTKFSEFSEMLGLAQSIESGLSSASCLYEFFSNETNIANLKEWEASYGLYEPIISTHSLPKKVASVQSVTAGMVGARARRRDSIRFGFEFENLIDALVETGKLLPKDIIPNPQVKISNSQREEIEDDLFGVSYNLTRMLSSVSGVPIPEVAMFDEDVESNGSSQKVGPISEVELSELKKARKDRLLVKQKLSKHEGILVRLTLKHDKFFGDYKEQFSKAVGGIDPDLIQIGWLADDEVLGSIPQYLQYTQQLENALQCGVMTREQVEDIVKGIRFQACDKSGCTLRKFCPTYRVETTHNPQDKAQQKFSLRLLLRQLIQKSRDIQRQKRLANPGQPNILPLPDAQSIKDHEIGPVKDELAESLIRMQEAAANERERLKAEKEAKRSKKKSPTPVAAPWSPDGPDAGSQAVAVPAPETQRRSRRRKSTPETSDGVKTDTGDKPEVKPEGERKPKAKNGGGGRKKTGGNKGEFKPLKLDY